MMSVEPPPREMRILRWIYVVTAGAYVGGTLFTISQIVFRQKGLSRSVPYVGLLPLAEHVSAGVDIVLVSGFGLVGAAVYGVFAWRLPRAGARLRTCILVAVPLLPVIDFLFGFNQGAPQIALPILGVILLCRDPLRAYFRERSRSDPKRYSAVADQ